MGYDLAAQYQALVTELRAARKVVKASRKQPRTTKGNAAALTEAAYVDLDVALADYDATPKAVLDHQPDRTT